MGDTYSLDIYTHKLGPFLEACVEENLPAIMEHGVFNMQFKLYATICTMRRGQILFSDTVSGYTFSRQTVPAHPLSPRTRELIEICNAFFSATFNAVLVNIYLDGTCSVSDHADKDIGPSGVPTFSTGLPRQFIAKHKVKTAGPNVVVTTCTDQMIHMRGADFQRHCVHTIPPTREGAAILAAEAKARKTARDQELPPPALVPVDLESILASPELLSQVRVSFTLREHAIKKEKRVREGGGGGAASRKAKC